jgi:hypothetical protein
MRRTIATLLLPAWLLAGCYHYTPAEVGDARPGSSVRLRVTDVQASRFAELMPVPTRTFEGRVVDASPDSLMLEVPISTDVRGVRIETIHQRMDFPRAGVLDTELRTLDGTRTALLGAGAVALIGIALANTLVNAFRSDSPQPGEGNELVVPVFLRIRW